MKIFILAIRLKIYTDAGNYRAWEDGTYSPSCN